MLVPDLLKNLSLTVTAIHIYIKYILNIFMYCHLLLHLL